MDKDCGCTGPMGLSPESVNSEHCRFPAVVAELEAARERIEKVQVDAGILVEQRDSLNSSLLECEDQIEKLEQERDSLKATCDSAIKYWGEDSDNWQQQWEMLQNKVIQAEQERDALAGELAKYKAFVRKCGPSSRYTTDLNSNEIEYERCRACYEEDIAGYLEHRPVMVDDCARTAQTSTITHRPDCIYIAALQETQ